MSPGNVAASQDFTVNAIATVSIAFADSSVLTGESATATVTFSEAPTGLDVSDFSVNVGTVDSVTGTGLTRTVTITAPSAGTGTITLTLAANSIEEGNLAASDTIDYAPPVDAVLSITTSAASVLTGVTVTVTFSFDKAVTGFTAADVAVSTEAIKGR